MAGYTHQIALTAGFSLLFLFCPQHHATQPSRTFEWAVIGAGPAGIAALGTLIDHGVQPDTIAWFDPKFAVGRIGQHYHNVPGNAQTKDYISFIESCNTFTQVPSNALNTLYKLNPEVEYDLEVIAQPLQDITDHLKQQVKTYQAYVTSIKPNHSFWAISTDDGKAIHSKKVVLATGCHPKKLAYPVDYEIPLDIALDKHRLASFVEPDDTVAVVGDAHSAILVIKNLHEFGVGKIVNFYKNPLTYSFDTGTGNRVSNTGLAGPVGRWAFETLEQGALPHIIRIKNDQQARDRWLNQCNKIVYAIGYQRNKVPCNIPVESYDDQTGIIAPSLYGIGIAFPERSLNGAGQPEKRIGLKNFMEYAKKVVPQWIMLRLDHTLIRRSSYYLPILLHYA